ncbi:hypothetical protein RYX36_026730 [Vicia faba]
MMNKLTVFSALIVIFSFFIFNFEISERWYRIEMMHRVFCGFRCIGVAIFVFYCNVVILFLPLFWSLLFSFFLCVAVFSRFRLRSTLAFSIELLLFVNFSFGDLFYYLKFLSSLFFYSIIVLIILWKREKINLPF